jgi:hypothetical protein
MIPAIKKGRRDADTLDVTSTVPQDNADNVAVNSTVQISFNESLQSATVNSSTILLEKEE